MRKRTGTGTGRTQRTRRGGRQRWLRTSSNCCGIRHDSFGGVKEGVVPQMAFKLILTTKPETRDRTVNPMQNKKESNAHQTHDIIIRKKQMTEPDELLFNDSNLFKQGVKVQSWPSQCCGSHSALFSTFSFT